MVAPKHGSVKAVVALAAVLGFSLACASTMSEPTEGAVMNLTDVAVESGEEITVVTLVGLGDPMYTTEYDAETQTVVIDLASVDADEAMDRVEVYDGVVDHVSTSTWSEEGAEPMTRVEVALGISAGYEAFMTEDGLVIEVSESFPVVVAEAVAQDEALATADDATEDEGVEDPWEAESSQGEALAAATAPEWEETAAGEEAPVTQIGIASPPEATMLSAVSVRVLETGALVHVQANGSIWAVESFVVDNPDRLVVDLPGMKTMAEVDNLAVDHPMVKSVRIGAHADKVRVVIDSGEASEGFSGRSVMPSTDGLYVALGHGDEVAAALTEGIESSVGTWTESQLALRSAPGESDAPATEWAEEAEGVAEEIALEAAPEEAPNEDAEETWPAAPDEAAGEALPVEVAAWDEAETVTEEVLPEAAQSETAEEEEMAAAEAPVAEESAGEAGPIEVAAWDEAEEAEETETAIDETLAEETASDEMAAEAAPVEEAEVEYIAEVTPVVPSSTAIHGVHYTAMDDMDRIAVLSEGLVDYAVHSPDSETVVVSLFDATISPQVAGRIRGQSGGPVSLVTIFEQPEMEQSEVRVVVTRAPDQEPVISRKGTLLFIDFEHLGVAAAAPPAFPEEQGAGLTVATAEAVTGGSEEAVVVEDEAMVAEEVEAAAESQLAEAAAVDALTETAGMDDFDESAFDFPADAESSDDFASLEGPLDDFEDFDDLGAGAGTGGPASLEPPAAVEVLREGGLTDGKKYAGRRISLDFNNVPVADVLRLIAEVSDLNLIAGDEVKGAVTIRLVDTPWDQALDVVLLTKGLGFVRVGNILRVAPADILAAEEELRLQERRNREKLEDLMVKLLPVNYAGVADMQKLVKRLLSSRGTANIDERTNTLILKDIASVIDEAVALVKAVDTETPQVMIEAKIVEANLNFARELGSSWSLSSQPLQDPFSGTTLRDDLGSSDFRLHGSNSIAFSNPITSTPTALADLGAFLLDEKMDLNVALRAAESMGEGKVISSPRVVTLDNGEATIEQGVSIPFQTFEGGDAKLEFIDAVLSLKVVPHITADRSIIMDIEVTRNAPDESVPTPTGSPAIAKAEAATETLVKDGQTLVLGGIYTIDKTERESRVPYLYRLPVIGTAFRSKELTDIRKELLIFVTPRIVKSPSLAAGK